GLDALGDADLGHRSLSFGRDLLDPFERRPEGEAEAADPLVEGVLREALRRRSAGERRRYVHRGALSDSDDRLDMARDPGALVDAGDRDPRSLVGLALEHHLKLLRRVLLHREEVLEPDVLEQSDAPEGAGGRRPHEIDERRPGKYDGAEQA